MITGRVIGLVLLCGLVLSSAACGPKDAADRDGEAADDRMGPGMMMRMMENMPEGIPASALPEPRSRGARLVARYCSQCHGIPRPERLSAAEWPATLERMFARMEGMEGMEGMMGGRMRGRMSDVAAPTAAERQAILAYLQTHAFRAIAEEELPDDSPAAALFARTCSRCHALPDPAQHPPEEWPGVVVRMRANMEAMDVEGITDAQAQAIVRYLKASAGREDSPPAGA